MEITKSDAIVWMAIKIGTSDGTFSEQEMFDAITKTSYAKFFNDAYSNGISEKIDSNELNAHSAISLMQQLPREEKIEALAICLGIAISDRVPSSARAVPITAAQARAIDSKRRIGETSINEKKADITAQVSIKPFDVHKSMLAWLMHRNHMDSRRDLDSI